MLLERRLTECDEKSQVIAEKSGVSYDAICRMRRNGIKNRTGNAVALCDYFGVKARTRESRKRLDLSEAIMEAWDHSPVQAKLFIDLIKAASRYKLARSRGRN